MTTTASPYFLLSALLLATPVLATPVAPPVRSACAAQGTTASAAAASDIDYAAINQHLTTPDDRQRLAGLQGDVKKLRESRAPEAVLVRHRLSYALAQAQAGLGRHDAAMATLKQLPVSSPQAPEALALLAELEVAQGNPDAGVRWLRQLADVFPAEAVSVAALWRAAELSEPGSPQAIALWRQAVEYADQGLATARRWQAQSGQPGFLDEVTGGSLAPELWRLARATLGSRAFASADAVQAEARRQLHCLTATREAQLRQMDRNPRLLASLADTVDTLTAQLRIAREDVGRREQAFLATARSLRECESRAGNCAALNERHGAQGRELTGWRNRIRSLEGKLAFLRTEEKSLQGSPAVDSAGTAVASALGSRLGSSRGFMREGLQQSLADAVREWEGLSAQAHYKLAIAQEQHVDPAVMPARHPVPTGSPQGAN